MSQCETKVVAIASVVNGSPAPLNYRVVADHDDFLLINKSPGANLHRNQRGRSLLDQLADDFPAHRLLLVHRLDDVTSGLLLLAKHSAAAAELAEQFRSRAVQKFYLAIADGKPRKKQGLIVGDLEKSRGGSYKLSRRTDNPSRTRFISASVGAGQRLYLLRPETGKTHQLRVVLSSLGVPILGDRRYGGADSDRAYLHAWVLCFRYGGQDFRFQCAPTYGIRFQSPAVNEALRHWHEPWQLPWPGAAAQNTL